ncbi:MAG: AbrB/MazE/SpoVT family DNA-binding domain-containing protein [Syntrophomonadaceae bacterium]|nr:AbrB/MazE/SpoVT family DNA-binding domain-containing protein [Syntrophomonadaceae bacterium]
MSVVKIGKRGTLVIPAEIRKQIKIKEGDEFLIDTSESGVMYIIRKPADFIEALKEAGQGIWIDPVNYVRGERETWQ